MKSCTHNIISGQVHTSLALKPEYGTVSEYILREAMAEYYEVELILTGVKIVPHIGGGHYSWIIAATLDNSLPNEIRSFLGLTTTTKYNAHISLLAKSVGVY